MLNIGVIGAGHLGKIHIRCIKDIPAYRIAGFYDIDPHISAKVEKEFGIRAFSSAEELMEQAEVIDIVTPTVSHFAIAAAALKNSKHVFIEKPVVATPDEARKLMAIAHEADVLVQVGHVERFNPALKAAMPYIKSPMFIEAHRLAPFNQRGSDVPVILDLMIHDIDVVLHLVRANIRKVSANGVAVISDTADIANARLEFDNGCVANLTASRMSVKPMRKTRFFQRDTYISVDYLEKKTSILRLKELNGEAPHPDLPLFEPGNGKPGRQIVFEQPAIHHINAIQTELESFAKSIESHTSPMVTLSDGFQALETAYMILDKVNESISHYTP